MQQTKQILIGTEGIIIKAFSDLNVLSPRFLISPLVYNMVMIMSKKYSNMLDSNIGFVIEVESGQQKQTESELSEIFNNKK